MVFQSYKYPFDSFTIQSYKYQFDSYYSNTDSRQFLPLCLNTFQLNDYSIICVNYGLLFDFCS